MRNLGAVLVLVLFASACGGRQPVAPSPPSAVVADGSPQATNYLNEIIGLMQSNSINRSQINWTDFRAQIFARAQGAQTIADTYPAIALALGLLGDRHSFYTAAGGSGIGNPSGRRCAAASVSAPVLPADIGYVRVAGFGGTDAAAVRAFADSVQDQIRTGDRPTLVGWIVDLRGNGGGNMWPMLAGVGPVLGDGTAGYFISPDGFSSEWGYSNGASTVNGNAQARVSSVYILVRTAPRVAVLTDHLVASSGEAVAIAFRARPNARSFGAATCGLSTANQSYRLSDGAMLYLTVAVMADRTRTSYGDSIAPDEIVSGDGEVVERAIAWLRAFSST